MMNIKPLVLGLVDAEPSVRQAAEEGMRYALPASAIEIVDEAFRGTTELQVKVLPYLWGTISSQDGEYRAIADAIVARLLTVTRPGDLRAATIRLFESIIAERDEVFDYVLTAWGSAAKSELTSIASTLRAVASDPRAQSILESLAANDDPGVRQIALRSLYGRERFSNDLRSVGGFIISNDDERADALRALTDLEESLQRLEDSLPTEIVERLHGVIYPLIGQLMAYLQERTDSPTALHALRTRAAHATGRVIESAATITLVTNLPVLSHNVRNATARVAELLSQLG